MGTHVLVSKGQDFEIINSTVNTTGAEIDPSLSPDRKANSFTIQARTSADLLLSRELNGTQYWTIKSGATLSLELKSAKEQPFFVRSTSGTVVVEVIVYW